MGQRLDSANGGFQPQMAQLNWQLQRQFAQWFTTSRSCWGRFAAATSASSDSTAWWRWIRATAKRSGAGRTCRSAATCSATTSTCLRFRPTRDEATVLRAWDGELVGKRRIPRISGRQVFPNGEQKTIFGRFEETCLATLGRNLLLWWPEGNQRELTLVDPLEGRDLWRGRKFAANARACVVNNEVVGVMEPGGRFVLVSLPDGRTIADLKLEAEPSLMDMSLDVEATSTCC